MSLDCCRLLVLVGWSMPSFFDDKGWQVSRVAWISSEVLIDDIGLSVPVVQGALGIWSDNSVFSRKVLHDSWRCLS